MAVRRRKPNRERGEGKVATIRNNLLKAAHNIRTILKQLRGVRREAGIHKRDKLRFEMFETMAYKLADDLERAYDNMYRDVYHVEELLKRLERHVERVQREIRAVADSTLDKLQKALDMLNTVLEEARDDSELRQRVDNMREALSRVRRDVENAKGDVAEIRHVARGSLPDLMLELSTSMPKELKFVQFGEHRDEELEIVEAKGPLYVKLYTLLERLAEVQKLLDATAEVVNNLEDLKFRMSLLRLYTKDM